jgi:excinuclease ABC subunit C
VGKAKNLANRLKSYKNEKLLDPKTKLLLRNLNRVKYIQLETEFEAILLEAELIKNHRPRFNLRLKDDKSPLYIQITDDAYPRVLAKRKTELADTKKRFKIFGPFQSATQAKMVLRSVRKLFPFCNAMPTQNNKRKPCFYYHLKLCPGACISEISEKDYKKIIDNLSLFLRGHKSKVLRIIKKKMEYSSNNMNFEEAARYRDIYDSIISMTQNSHLSSPDFHFKQHKNYKAILTELWTLLSPYFSVNLNKVPKKPFFRIEAYDVSNLSGKHATASMIVFQDGKSNKKQYRRFRIKFSEQPNDTLMLYEAVIRRLNHRDWKLPELILVDGGKGQVRAVRKALTTKGLHHRILVVGLTKKFEEIIVQKFKFHKIHLKKSSPVLLFLMEIRDEAHRFARNYHLLLRKKSFLKN